MVDVAAMHAVPTALLADADVLIDYRDSDLAILDLVCQHVAKVIVLPAVLDEVHGVTTADCIRLGIKIIEVDTALMLEATQIESSVSFNDRLCLVVCRAKGWTCVTSDGALRRLCRRHCVDTQFCLGLMVDLVAAGVLTRRRAMAVACRIQVSNPSHVNDRVIRRFVRRLNSAVQR